MRIEEILDYKLRKLLADKANSVGDEDKKFILAQAKVKIQTYCSVYFKFNASSGYYFHD